MAVALHVALKSAGERSQCTAEDVVDRSERARVYTVSHMIACRSEQTCPPELKTLRSELPETTCRVGETASRCALRAKSVSNRETLSRKVRSLLNKVSPETLSCLADQVLSLTYESIGDIETLCGLLFDVAITEHHYSEMYADLCKALSGRLPAFKDAPMTFTRALLNRCQNEFDNVYTVSDSRRVRVLGNMKFIGHLFLRRVITQKIVRFVVSHLLACERPEEHYVECVTALLRSIGATLEASDAGKRHLRNYMLRLTELSRKTYPPRIKFQIQNLLELQQNGWLGKDHAERARTRQEVRQDAVRERRALAHGANPTRRRLAGERPQYILDQMEDERRQTERRAVLTADVRQLLGDFEGRNMELLERNWTRITIDVPGVVPIVGVLIDLGVTDPTLRDVAAMAVTGLVRRGQVSWSDLAEAMSPTLWELDHLRTVKPQADVFCLTIVAQLLMDPGVGQFDFCILEGLPHQSSFNLLCRALLMLKRLGMKALRFALQMSSTSLMNFLGLDAKGLHDCLVSSGVLTDPLKDVMPKVRAALSCGFSVELVESCFEQASDGFAMQLLSEVVAVLKLDWEIDVAGFLRHFMSRHPKTDVVDALIFVSCVHRLNHEEVVRLCQLLDITKEDLLRWLREPIVSSEKCMMPVIRDVLASL